MLSLHKVHNEEVMCLSACFITCITEWSLMKFNIEEGFTPKDVR
jgi:hypothetical protein